MSITYCVTEGKDHADNHRPLRLYTGEYWLELRANADRTYTVEWSGGAPGFATFSSLGAAQAYWLEAINETAQGEFGNSVMPWEVENAP